MPYAFTADEIFEMAEQIERNGAAFYRRAADLVSDGESRQILTDLAVMEVKHQQTFAAMRRDLDARETAPTVFDPDAETVLYARALADGRVFNLKADPVEGLTDHTSLQEILKRAIEREKDSVVFFAGMRELAFAQREKGKVDGIIREEISHIALLNKRLGAM
ncbi:MAG: ferritin family protein [Candidatus Sumerlaeota bacterium]|nr:ferritin family protein [Candidatus Sumerlaeota bacterium]